MGRVMVQYMNILKRVSLKTKIEIQHLQKYTTSNDITTNKNQVYNKGIDEAGRTLEKYKLIQVKSLDEAIATNDSVQALKGYLHLHKIDKLQYIPVELHSEVLRSIKYFPNNSTSKEQVRLKLLDVLNLLDIYKVQLNEQDFRHLVAVYTSINEFKEAELWWKKLLETTELPTIDSFTALAYFYLKSNQLTKLFELELQIKNLHIRPNQLFRFYLMEAYGKLKDGNSVIETFQKIVDQIDRTIPSSSPSTTNNEMDEKIQLKRINMQVYVKFFNNLIHCKLTNLDFIQNILHVMQAQGLQLERRVAYPIIQIYLNHNQTESCLPLLPYLGQGIYLDVKIKLCRKLALLYYKTNFPELLGTNLSKQEFLLMFKDQGTNQKFQRNSVATRIIQGFLKINKNYQLPQHIEDWLHNPVVEDGCKI